MILNLSLREARKIFERREDTSVEEVCLYDFDPTQQGVAISPYGWPRVRAMMVDLRKKPYVVGYFLATEIDLVEGIYELKSLFGDHDVTILVSRPNYYWMYGASPLITEIQLYLLKPYKPVLHFFPQNIFVMLQRSSRGN